MSFVAQVLIPVGIMVVVVAMVKGLWPEPEGRYFETNGVEVRGRRR